MPSLDSCIASIFEPGNPGNATDSGTITIPRYPRDVAVEETAAASDVTDGSLFAIYNVLVTETATAADSPLADYGVSVSEAATSDSAQDATVVSAPVGRSAMILGAFVNPSASRQANVAGIMVNL